MLIIQAHIKKSENDSTLKLNKIEYTRISFNSVNCVSYCVCIHYWVDCMSTMRFVLNFLLNRQRLDSYGYLNET